MILQIKWCDLLTHENISEHVHGYTGAHARRKITFLGCFYFKLKSSGIFKCPVYIM